MLYPQWSRVRYTGALSTKQAGEDAKVIEHIQNTPGRRLYKIKFYAEAQGCYQELIVDESELNIPEEFIYRWVSASGKSHRTYTTPGVAKAQANYNKGKRQRARVIWEDC